VAAYATKDGCFDFQTIDYTVQVFKKPVADWLLSKNPCGKDTLHFTDNSIGYQKTIVQWRWDFGDGEISNLKDPDKFYVKYGDQNIALRVITDIGCFADTIKSIHLSDNPKADFSISGNNCFGNLLSFTDRSTFASDSIVKWKWDFGDNTFSDIQNPTRQYNTSETFNVHLTVYNTYDCADDTIKQFTVYSIPEINIAQEVTVIENNALTLQPAYSGTGLKYKWSPPVYLNSDTIPFPVTIPKDDILYNITVTGDGNCSSSKNVFVNVIQILHIPNVFSPNGDGINDKWIITNIDKYPESIIEIFNRYGQQLFYSIGYSKPWDGTYKDQPLPTGTYYYIINTHNNYLPVYKGYILILR
jgi:gliding motility-associated-like protein